MAPSSTKSRKQKLDEESFQKLLAAAFVVQEHHQGRTDSAAATSGTPSRGTEQRDDLDLPPRPPYAYVMEEIVATQHQIQTRRLELLQAMNLIVERVRTITHADGAAIALLEENINELTYRAAAGASSRMAGQRLKRSSALCAESVRNGTTLQTLDPAGDFRVDSKVCAQRGVRGLITVPVYRDESIAGALEVVFTKSGSFLEQDVRTCQVMAGMVTEALDRAAEIELKKALVDERATMLKALEKLKPELERLRESPPATETPTRTKAIPCTACGAMIGPADSKCVHCGAPLPLSSSSSEAPQRTLGSAVHKKGLDNLNRPESTRTRQSLEKDNGNQHSSSRLLKAPKRPLVPPDPTQDMDAVETSDAEFEIPSSVIDELEKRLQEFDPDRNIVTEDLVESEEIDREELEAASTDDAAEPEYSEQTETATDDVSEALALPEPGSLENTELRITPVATGDEAWKSAWKTKAWLDSITDRRAQAVLLRFLNRYRGEIYLAAAILVVGFAIWWSTWGNKTAAYPAENTTVSSRRRVKPPVADLTLFEKFLVTIGLAEAPPAPVYQGNPDTQVWVDLQTGLYYCSNADLYGNTPKGKVTTQKDAQMDQFEPAYRKACE